MRAEARSTVDAPIEDVFAVLADPERLDEWVDGVVAPRLVGERPVGVGSRFRSGYAAGGRVHPVTHQVTAFEPPRTVVYRSRSGPFPYGLRVDLARVPGRPGATAVRAVVDVGADGRFTAVTFALLGPVLRRLAARQLRGEIDALGVAARSTLVTVDPGRDVDPTSPASREGEDASEATA